jgi:hypothetical protein
MSEVVFIVWCCDVITLLKSLTGVASVAEET